MNCAISVTSLDLDELSEVSMGIAEGIAAVKTGFDIAKSVAELVKQKEIDPNDILSRLLLLQQYMLDSQRALNEADEELRSVRQLLDRRKSLDDDRLWEPDGQFYVRKSEKDSGMFIPYCPTCWHAADNAVPMAPHHQPGTYKCALHEPIYRTKENDAYHERQREIVRNVNRGPRGGGWMGR